MEGKGVDMREELLKIIEKNSRIDLKELAVILGVSCSSGACRRSIPPSTI